MSTENIVITVTETGARQVSRNIENIGTSAGKARSNVDLMTKSLNQLNAAANALKNADSGAAKMAATLARLDAANGRSALSQQRLATEYQRTQLMMAKAEQQTARNSAAQDRAALSAMRLESAQGRAASAARGHSASLEGLKATLVGLASAMSLREVITMADAWIIAQGKINIFTHSAAETTVVMERLFEIAQKTRQPIDAVASSFHQLSIAGSALGATQNQLLTFTQAIGNALAIQGTDANTARGGILQLGQAMNEGIVRAQEYNSMINAMPIVLKTVANNLDGVGGSLAKLRQRMLEGKLYSKDFFAALLKGAPELEKLFDRAGKTFGQAFTVMQNGLKRYIGQMNEASGASRTFYDIAVVVSRNIDNIVKVMIALIAPKIVSGLYAITLQLRAMAVAAAANPYVTLAAALTALTVAAILYKDQIVLIEQNQVSLGDYMSASWAIAKDAATAVVNYFKNDFMTTLGDVGVSVDGIGAAFQQNRDTVALQVNQMVGTFVGFGKSIGIVLAGIAPAFKDAMVSAGNGMIETLESTVNKAIELSNKMRTKVGLDPYENVSIARIANPNEGKAADLGAAVKTAFTESVNYDYIGALTTQVGEGLDYLTAQATAGAIERHRLAAQDKKLLDEVNLDLANGNGEDFSGKTKQSAAEKKAARARESLRKYVGEQQAATDAANGMAAAYMAGGNAVAEMTRKQEIDEQVTKRGEIARKAVTKAINDQHDATDRLKVAQDVDSTRKEIADLNAQTAIIKINNDSMAAGKIAQDAYTASKALAAATAGMSAEAIAKESDELQVQLNILNESRSRNQATAELAGLIESTSNAQETYNRKLEHFKALEAYATTPAEIEAVRRAIIEAQAATSIWAQLTEGAIDRIDSSFASMWASVFDGTTSALDGMKKAVKQWLAEMAHMLLTKPLLISFTNALTGSEKSGGIGEIWSQIVGGSGQGGGGGVMGMISSAKNVIDIASSKFSESIMNGWASGGDSLANNITGAFEGGSNYVSDAISGAFTAGSASASVAAEVSAQTFSAAISEGAVQFGSQFSAEVGGAALSYEAASVASANALSQTLSTISTVLSVIGTAYTVFTAFQDYGVEGGVTTAAFAAAGAYIGSIVPVIGTAIGAAVGAVIGSIASASWFGGPNYEQLVSSAEGSYSNGKFQDEGWYDGWKENKTRLGAGTDAQLMSYVQQFTTTMGMLYKTLGDGSDVSAAVTMRRRETSGDYSNGMAATLDSGEQITALKQYGLDVTENLTAYYDDFMGTFLAQAIVSSESLPQYFKSQFQAYSTDWEATADDVIATIESIFTRFNGVNGALGKIGIAGLKLDEAGMMASDSILNMVGALAGLDDEAATAQDKVDALNELVSSFYSAFYTNSEQFGDLAKTLNNSFGGFGLNLPDTRQAYRDMVKDIDVTTSAGQAMFATFLGLASAADAYYDQQDTYLDLFTSDGDKAKATLASVADQFKALGLAMPSSREGFVALVDGIDTATFAGKAMRASLIGMAQDADAAFTIMEQSALDLKNAAREAAMDGANNAFSALQRAVEAQKALLAAAYEVQSKALNTSLDTASEALSNLTDLSNGLKDALKTMTSQSDESVKVLYAQGMATLQSAAAIARAGGSLANFEGLDDALTAVTGNSADDYQDWAKFARDQGVATNLIDELNDKTAGQLTTQEKIVANLEKQIELLEEKYKSDTDALDAALEFAQSQLDALNGVDTSVKSVEDAVNAMNSAVVAAIATITGKGTTAGNGVLIDTAYKDILGRDADKDGKQYWQDQLASGAINYDQLAGAIKNAGIENAIKDAYKDVLGSSADAAGAAYWAGQVNSGALTIAQLEQAIKNAAVANGSIKGYAMGGYVGSGMAIFGETGPEAVDLSRGYVHNATNTRDMLSTSNEDIVELLLEAVQELREIRSYSGQTVENTSKTTKTLQDVRDGGLEVYTTPSDA